MTSQTAPQSTNTEFDFWLGKWNCVGKSRKAPGEDVWVDTTCKNVIKRTLGNKVIEENFSMPGFTGRSWTVFHQNQKKWVQTWVDDSGAYLTFEGGMEGKDMVLNQIMPPTTKIRMRMRFTNIEKSSLVWRWQRSPDEGRTWESQWELNYSRAK